jgi:hypothetical protein
MKIQLDRRERLAGAFIVLTALLVVTFFVGAGLRNRWLLPRTTFHTLVRQGDGLRRGSPILLSGVEVGEVGELSIQDDNRIDVELRVLDRHAHRLREGTHAQVRRVFGIGEKRVHLTTSDRPGRVLAAGTLLPAEEPLEVLDLMAEMDFGTYLRTLDRALSALEPVLSRLEDEHGFDRLVATFERVDRMLGAMEEPLVALIKDPALRGTVTGAHALLVDPNTKKLVRGAATALEPERLSGLLTKLDATLSRLDALTDPNAPLPRVLTGADRMLNDGRADRLVGSLERLSDEKRMGRILDNMSVLAEQTSKIAPEIPALTRELNVTLREAVVVLRALQKTWILEGKSEDARKELGH